MGTGGPDEQDEGARHGHRSELSGSASDVVQARDVHGGVHFHGADRSAQPAPRQLPRDVSDFVNRVDDLDRLNGVLADERDEPLVVGVFVIVGTAGVGKTSLALHWAHSVRQRFPDGQLFVNMRGYDPGPPVSPEQALDRFLRALGVRPDAIPADLEERAAWYRSLLADRRVLVVLDNAATVRQVRPLLPGTADSLVLVTSRSRLSGLVARDGARRLSLDVLTEQDAVNLLRVSTAGYRGQDDQAELVEMARLCARLPLALRIAAERASSRPLMLLTELIGDLRDESALWDALRADDDEEADAVRTVFAWSYRALPEPAARLFRMLGLHPGPEFGVPAAAVLTGVTVSHARQLMDDLVGVHMLQQHAPGRYQFHDLLRVFAADQAVEHETAESRRAILERVLTWYVHMANNVVATIAPFDRRPAIDPPQAGLTPASFSTYDEAFRWYEWERTNLVAATRAAADADLHRLAWQLPAVLASVYAEQNAFEDWFTTGRIGLDSARRVHDRRGEAELLDSLGMACVQSHRLDQAEEYHRAALAVRQEIGDLYGEAMSINALGLLGWRRRRLAEATAHFEESLAIVRELGDPSWETVLLSNLGAIYYDLDRVEQAAEALVVAVRKCRELGDRASEGNALFLLAMAQRELGQTNEALASIEGALTIADEDSRDGWGAYWLLELARIQRALGQPAEALTSCQRSAAIQRRLGDRSREAMALNGTGEAYRELGMPEEAVKFHRLAAATHQELGDRWQLAMALVNLASALGETENSEQARPHWEEAATILAEFDDPRAVGMRERVNKIRSM